MSAAVLAGLAGGAAGLDPALLAALGVDPAALSALGESLDAASIYSEPPIKGNVSVEGGRGGVEERAGSGRRLKGLDGAICWKLSDTRSYYEPTQQRCYFGIISDGYAGGMEQCQKLVVRACSICG